MDKILLVAIGMLLILFFVSLFQKEETDSSDGMNITRKKETFIHIENQDIY
ncbi:MAG: hypothetical protein J0H55_04330 [Chitinophagaceae bacterium]|nr:hypothetical protein [Chitinophagaceae bacterium]